MKNLVAYVLLVFCFLAGCKTLVSDLYITTQVVQNSLDLPVRIEVFHGNKISDVLEIGAGEEISKSYETTSYIPPNFEFCDSVRFTFDDSRIKVDVVNNYLDSINILLVENHTKVDGSYLYVINENDLKEAR